MYMLYVDEQVRIATIVVGGDDARAIVRSSCGCAGHARQMDHDLSVYDSASTTVDRNLLF